MKLNHLDLAVHDVPATRAIFERILDFTCTLGKEGGPFAVLRDDDGFTLVLHRAKPGATYPSGFHFGFNVDSRSEVDAMYRRLHEASLAGAAPAVNPRGYMFYWSLPGEILVEVSTRA